LRRFFCYILILILLISFKSNFGFGQPLVWDYLVSGNINSVSMTPDHSYICTGGIGGVYLIDFELSNSKAIWNYKTFDQIQSVKMSSDGEYIVAGSKEKSVYLFDKGFTANKYLWRYRYKNGKEDLKKAQWYLNKLIEVYDGKS